MFPVASRTTVAADQLEGRTNVEREVASLYEKHRCEVSEVSHLRCISWISVLTDAEGHSQVGDTRYQDGQQGTFRNGCLWIL